MAQNIFTIPSLFSDEIVNFFSKVQLGPVIEGSFIPNRIRSISKLVPDPSSLKVTDRPLGSVLFFTQELILGRTNPLYRIANLEFMNKLFVLYTLEAKMTDRFNSATPEMREFLPETIAKTRAQVAKSGKTLDLDHLRFIHILNLGPNSRVRILTTDYFELMQEEITEIYRPFFPDQEEITPQMVIDYQIRMLSLAIAEKNRQRSHKPDLDDEQAR